MSHRLTPTFDALVRQRRAGLWVEDVEALGVHGQTQRLTAPHGGVGHDPSGEARPVFLGQQRLVGSTRAHGRSRGVGWRSLWTRAGGVAIGVYMLHLSALALCAAVVAAGLPVPDRLTTTWWISRPLWWAAVLATTAALIAATAAVGRVLSRGRRERSLAARGRALAGVVVATAASAYVGLEGPASAANALTCSTLFVAAWLVLREEWVRPRIKMEAS